MLLNILDNTWTLFLEAAPWLMVGLIAAGLIKAWVPEQRMVAWLGGNGLWPVTKAALIGAPLPLCSCGVIPAALGLHRAGASRASTTAFLIATPETGADSIGVSYALLGPFLTVMRPVAAILSGIITGVVAGLTPETRAVPVAVSPAAAANCGCDGPAADPPQESAACCGSGCGSEQAFAEPTGPWTRTWSGLRYALSDVLDDFSVWLFIGLVVAGITSTLVPPSTLAQYGGGLSAMLLMLVVGIPLYVCATESTPIATAMLVAGVSPGTVLVFLLAGPATNLGTVGALNREFGARFVAAYLAGISVCALAFGLLTNHLAGAFGLDIQAQLHTGRQLIPHWLALASAIVLAAMAIRPLRRALFTLFSQKPGSDPSFP
ncbi:MAG: SO_0444 family Cu/Zn efflux transporter [Gammaproteobacteria bacterium]